MAKGWESKSIEEQQAERAAPATSRKELMDGQKTRRQQELELQREQILSARTASPHRRAALEAALIEVEKKLAAIQEGGSSS